MSSEPAETRDVAYISDRGHPDRNAAPWLALSCCLIAVAVQMVDMTIVNIALPSLGTDLGASSGQQLLVLTAYTLAFACTFLTASRIGERTGRRRLFIAALAGFTLITALIVEPAAGIDIPTIIAPLIIGGIGMGLFVAPIQATMLSGTSEHNVDSACGTVPTIQQIGASVGLAIIGLLFFNQVAAHSDSAASAARETLSQDIASTNVAESLRPFVINEFTRCASA
ncbi:MFS transporter [Williamsia soli]|uniref:MFS transporter n=1 Tax=Williamsia soli TaxID=364929 RepID=UPI001A9E6A77|nr:MFS transporter [Williamsia soli]